MTIKPRRLKQWTIAHRATAALFLLLLFLGRFEWFPFFKGSTASTRVLDMIFLADPLATLETTLASRQLHATLWVAAGLLVLLYALLGRAFCGWVCPLGLVLELNDEVRTRINRFLRRHKLALPNFQLPRNTKYVLLITFLLLSLANRLPVFQLVSPINLLTRSLVFEPGVGLVIVGVIVMVEYGAPRVWCRALCPLGALYSLIGRWGRLRVWINPEQGRTCVMCRQCTFQCPMGIRVLEDYVAPSKPSIDDPECSRCGVCLETCPRGTLTFRWWQTT